MKTITHKAGETQVGAPRAEVGAQPPADQDSDELQGAKAGERMWKAELLRLAKAIHEISGVPVEEGYEAALKVLRGASSPAPSTPAICNERVCHLIAGASWYVCALPRGHKEPGHRARGSCFKHGTYVMREAGVSPQCPKCVSGAPTGEGARNGSSAISNPAVHSGDSHAVVGAAAVVPSGEGVEHGRIDSVPGDCGDSATHPDLPHHRQTEQETVVPSGGAPPMSAEQFWAIWIETDAGKNSYRNDPMKVGRLKFAEAYAASSNATLNEQLQILAQNCADHANQAGKFALEILGLKVELRETKEELEATKGSLGDALHKIERLEGELREARQALQTIKEGK